MRPKKTICAERPTPYGIYVPPLLRQPQNITASSPSKYAVKAHSSSHVGALTFNGTTVPPSFLVYNAQPYAEAMHMLKVIEEKHAAIAARLPALRATDRLVAWSPRELTAARVNPSSDGGHWMMFPSACKHRFKFWGDIEMHSQSKVQDYRLATEPFAQHSLKGMHIHGVVRVNAC